MRTLVPLAMLLAAAVPDVSRAAERAWIDVAVRVYDVAPVADDDTRRALAIAAAVLAPADLEIHFTLCGTANPEPACSRILGGDELALRLVRGRVPLPRPTASAALGEALLNTRLRKASLATVYVERVERLAQESRADPIVLLGRAIAHELVHALTGRGTHTPRGLMRAVWSAWEVAQDRPQDWSLGNAERVLLRNRRADLQAAVR